uniref:aprataxin-like isoform X1 n=1 Tax=Styela clava TaxID=7725 RepID=UPI0019398417|nr:aprataxin-like isoform X1 [Styela clava]
MLFCSIYSTWFKMLFTMSESKIRRYEICYFEFYYLQMHFKLELLIFLNRNYHIALSLSFSMYFQCCNSTHAPILLPDGSPVVVGRSAETKISDKLCSRNQLELVANYNQKYVMVKQLGSNASQIEGIDIGHRKTDRLHAGQTLHVVDMKYPHKIAICIPNSGTTSSNTKKTKLPQEENTFSKRQKMTEKVAKNISDEENEANANNKNNSAQKPSYHWSQGLKGSMDDPSLRVSKDDKVVVIKDKYPKAKYHWLVMPIENIISCAHLRSEHLPLLKHMVKVGEQTIEDNISENDKPKTEFRYGYHAVHSMSHLHMHVISQDFDSDALKTKKHWNSFTTEYFVDAEDIINEIEKDGKVKNRKHMADLLKEPLRCHICKRDQKNMPELKKHILKCS